jgi:hypothetical protein
MPNHVTTIIEINDGNQEAINSMINKVDGEDKFDFNRIIPIPEEVKIEASTTGEWGLRYLNGETSILDNFDKKDREEAIELGKKYKANIEKYGHAEWYEWSVHNWGTKWNAYDLYMDDCQVIFSTAWSHPMPIMVALSKKFPDAVFHVIYADENTGYNVGDYTLRDGVVEDRTPEEGSVDAYEIAFEINGGSEMYKLVDGEYKFDESWDE